MAPGSLECTVLFRSTLPQYPKAKRIERENQPNFWDPLRFYSLFQSILHCMMHISEIVYH